MPPLPPPVPLPMKRSSGRGAVGEEQWERGAVGEEQWESSSGKEEERERGGSSNHIPTNQVVHFVQFPM